MHPNIVALLYGLVGLMFVVIGIPMARQSVKPNPWYGFRTPKTLADPAIWYSANKVAGIDLIVAGAALVLVAVALYLLRITLMPSLPIDKWMFAAFVLFLVGATCHSFWCLSRI